MLGNQFLLNDQASTVIITFDAETNEVKNEILPERLQLYPKLSQGVFQKDGIVFFLANKIVNGILKEPRIIEYSQAKNQFRALEENPSNQ